MCPLQPVKLRISPVNDARAPRHCNSSSLWRITSSTYCVFKLARPVSTWCHVLRNCVTAALNRARTLKPFVACRDLIIVIPLCAWERIRVMTIKRQATDRVMRVQFSGDAGAVSGGWLKNGEGRADDSP
jgi:hypothetical protein